MRRLTMVAAVAVGFGACSDPMDSLPAYYRITRIIPPPVYADWYDEVVRVAGVTPVAPFSSLAFYAVQPDRAGRGDWYSPNHGHTAVGMTIQRRHIFLAIGLLGHEPTVKHELLHAILGTDDHRHPAFSLYAWNPDWQPSVTMRYH